MKNNIKFILLIFVIILIIELITTVMITNFQNQKYKNTVNKTVSAIIGEVKKQYPNIEEEKIIQILHSENGNINEELSKYGIDIEKSQIITGLENVDKQNIRDNCIIAVIFTVTIAIVFIIYLKHKDKKIKDITKYIENIEKKDYKLNISQSSENELNQLESELYKITIMLKEEAENSKQDKTSLSDNVSDISHQLKTPLTSISIMLDNLKDNDKMDEETKTKFINEISRQIEWMKWLVISLLKFSKLDANVVELKNEQINVKELIDNVTKNMEVPLEIKEQEIIVQGNENINFVGDFNWQLEAITNIVKNCIEHAENGKKIHINYEQNNLYTKITIKDEGEGIAKEDLPHIFERFYKGKNSSENSIGIGLALAKTIIEKGKGQITCISEPNKGTTFEIKYMRI